MYDVSRFIDMFVLGSHNLISCVSVPCPERSQIWSPCEHAFCLDCARSDSICYLCDDRIQKIQTIKIMEGLFICAAPHCLKSFLKRTDFESHIHQSHADLLQPNGEKDNDNESEVQSAKQPAPSESTARGLPRSGSNSQFLDNEEKARRQQPLQRPMMPKPPFYGQPQNYMPDPQLDTNRPPGFDRPVFQNRFGTAQESGQFSDKQQGISSESGMPEYPAMQAMQQQPNFLVQMNANPMMPPQFALPPFQPDGAQPFYGAAAAAEGGSEQGSLLGFPPGGAAAAAAAGGMNFMGNYPQPWNVGPPQVSQGMGDGKGILAAPQQQQQQQAFHVHQPPPPPIPHPSQSNRGQYYSGEGSHDGQGFGWQQENRDSFGSGQD
ncbi:E3 ubiquitin-protein ligase HAKAI homolog [Linum grandiflorum]